MLSRIRKLALVTSAAAAALATSLGTGTANAVDPWLLNPGPCINVATARSTIISGRTVQVRYGDCDGKQYGWGRMLNYNSGDYIVFEVDLNGDRRADDAVWKLATDRNTTAAYPTSSNPDRAFRSCFVPDSPWDPDHRCNGANSTAWW